jgi:hypothetical protein
MLFDFSFTATKRREPSQLAVAMDTQGKRRNFYFPLFNSVMTTGSDELDLSHVFEIVNLWERILFQTLCQVPKKEPYESKNFE